MLEQGGGEEEDAVLAHSTGRTRSVVLLLEHDPLLERRVAASERFGPRDDGQARVGEKGLPLPVLVEALGGVHRLQRSLRNVLREEDAHLVAECEGGVVEYEIHYLLPSAGRALAAIDLASMPPRESVPTSALYECAK